MTSKLLEVDNMLNDLDDEDYQMVIRFIEFLSTNKKKKQLEKNEALLNQIQDMFKDDKDGVYLISLNSKYEPIKITDESSFKIFGRVLN